MRLRLPLTAAALTLAAAAALLALPAGGAAQGQGDKLYKIEWVRGKDAGGREKDLLDVFTGDDGVLYVTIHFRIRNADNSLAADVNQEEIVIKEDGQRVRDWKLSQPKRGGALTAVLALDCSGSMQDNGKMDQAQQAAGAFLDHLPARSNTGLILFDHQIIQAVPPARTPDKIDQTRRDVRALVNQARPRGGTAYLDAAVESLNLLKGVQGNKAVIVMTDGVDLNSQSTLDEVIRKANADRVPVYTIGVGSPGKNRPVTTVLVLDRSGSMQQPADDSDRRLKRTKIKALHEASCRFADSMRTNARTCLLPFDTRPAAPGEFTSDKSNLKKRMRELEPKGETALFDAACDALMTLKADMEETTRAGGDVGKRAVVVLTDGIDNRSHHRYEDVLEAATLDPARKTKIPIYLLGLGRPGELDEKTMQRLADATGGKYYPARNQEDLVRVFEQLSIQLHDDGIDEESLKRLAAETGGKYYPAADVSRLRLLFAEVADELQSTYTATFPSLRQRHDGTARGISVAVVRGGKEVSERTEQRYDLHGVVVAEMHPTVYLVLAALIGGLVALPFGLRRLRGNGAA